MRLLGIVPPLPKAVVETAGGNDAEQMGTDREVEMEDGGSGEDSEGEMSGVEGQDENDAHDPALQLLEAAGAAGG